MNITIPAALTLLFLLAGAGSSAADTPTANPAPTSAAAGQVAASPEAAILHEWPGAVPLGFNAQGRLLAYDSGRRVFEVHDLAATNAAVTGWNQTGGDGRVFGGALTADRRTVATVSEAGREQSQIQLWNALTGEKTGPAFASGDVAHVAFSPDGKTLAGVVARDGTVRVWDATTGALRWSMSLPRPMQVTWVGIEFSPDGRFLAARNSYALQIWDLAARQLAGGEAQNFYLAISPDWKLAYGSSLKATGQGRPQSALLNLGDPSLPRPSVHALPEEIVASLEMAAFSANGRMMVLAMRDQTIRLWSLAGRGVARQTPKTGGRIMRLLVSPDSRRLASYEVDLSRQRSTLRGSVRLWDMEIGLALGEARSHPGMFWDWYFDPGSRHLVVSFAHGNDTIGTQVWRLPPGEPSQAKATAPANPVAPPAEATETHPPAGVLPAEIQAFIAAKERQARALAAKLAVVPPAEFMHYFQAALAGNWRQASNAYANFNRRFEAGPFDEHSGKLSVIRQPALETHIALEHFALGQPKYATVFGRDIVASIPAGSIYFGGTDAGRGLVTTFAHSRTNDDAIVVLTQNALADSSYLEYLRLTTSQRIHIPTPAESQSAFQEYLTDAQGRLQHDRDFPNEPRQIKPGEDIRMVGGRAQVNGHVAVMGINALLARTIFEKNPERTFYVEESFPLDWMYPHLEPHGLIMKLNRTPLDQVPPEAVRRDEEFWSSRMKPLVGDWLKEDTAVAEVCDFIGRVFVRRDLKGFTGDAAYTGDPYACRAFSRLRSSLAGVYRWRAVNAPDEPERRRMSRAADLAFRQALALCPYSGEAVTRYVRALADDGRVGDALRVARTAAQFTETEAQAARLIRELEPGR